MPGLGRERRCQHLLPTELEDAPPVHKLPSAPRRGLQSLQLSGSQKFAKELFLTDHMEKSNHLTKRFFWSFGLLAFFL